MSQREQKQQRKPQDAEVELSLRKLIGSIVERSPSSSKNVRPPSAPQRPVSSALGESTSFPTAEHRSKSAFKRSRELERNRDQAQASEEGAWYDVRPPRVRESGVPVFENSRGVKEGKAVHILATEPAAKASQASNVYESQVATAAEDLESRLFKSRYGDARFGDSPRSDAAPAAAKMGPSRFPVASEEEQRWRDNMEQENSQLVEAMSEEERERHQAEIINQLGPGVSELLRKAREAQENKNKMQVNEKPTTYEPSGIPFQHRKKHPGVKNYNEEVDGGAPSSEYMRELPGGLGDEAEKLRRKQDDMAHPTPRHGKSRYTSPPRGILVNDSIPSSRSSTPGKARKLRFAEVTPDVVHVYQSEPPSPRKPILALPPPPADDSDIVKLTLKKKGLEHSFTADTTGMTVTSSTDVAVEQPEPEEGTPEYIRRKFFPNMPENVPALDWIEAKDDVVLDDEPRFDLSGSIIPPEQQAKLPTYLGLHHHAGPSAAAGYTLSDLLLLARSSVPAQRASILSVLGKIVRRLVLREPEFPPASLEKLGDVRQKSLATGLAAFAEKGSILVQAINLLWACIVFWDHDVVQKLQGIELWVPAPGREEETESSDEVSQAPVGADALSTLHFAAILPQLARNLELPSLPTESRFQLLAITYRLARHSIDISTQIVNTPQLVADIVRLLLLTPIAPVKSDPLPEPLALDLLCVLAMSSRANAKTLVGPADALLRFVTTSSNSLSSTAMWTRSLGESLLDGTLKLYCILAQYGLYAGVATTASEHFSNISRHLGGRSGDEGKVGVANLSKDTLRETWFRLLSTWMVCARDPHRTVPVHDLLWSQVVSWSWVEDVLSCRDVLIGRGASLGGIALWESLWSAKASWLEGCRVNSLKAGQEERNTVNALIAESWSSRSEKTILIDLITSLENALSTPSGDGLEEFSTFMARVDALGRSLNEFMRLCLACLDDSHDTMHECPPWILESSKLLSHLVERIILHPIWYQREPDSSDVHSILLSRLDSRRLQCMSSFLASYVKVSCKVSAKDEWFPLGAAVLQMLQPGEEQSAICLIEALMKAEGARGGDLKKLVLLMPFYRNAVRPDESVYLSPSIPTPESIQLCTTQWLPATRPTSPTSPFGLPLHWDWPSIPIDHLLHSGTSAVFTNPKAVPETWNASEVDLVQASLWLIKTIQEKLSSAGGQYFAFAFGMEHAAFTCMKVFMLEHNQHEQTDSAEEVFRNPLVERLMNDVLRPYQYSEARKSVARPREKSQGNRNWRQRIQKWESLEDVSRAFLSQGRTPFFQLYTDFLALYDAISFSHPIFARLLFPPTSNAYALDYRKLLWGDFGHVLRTVRISVEDMLVNREGLKAYLWPVESEPEMLGWYIRALVKWPLDGFVGFLAVHHVSCNIWRDLLAESQSAGNNVRGQPKGGEQARSPGISTTTTSLPKPEAVEPVPALASVSAALPSPAVPNLREKRARSLFQTLVAQARPDVVRDIVRYTQAPYTPPPSVPSSSLSSSTASAGTADADADANFGAIYIPPHCFSARSLSESQRLLRRRAIEEWGGPQMAEAMEREMLYGE